MSLWNCCLLCHFLWRLLLLDSLLLVLDILLLSVKHWSAHSCTFQFVFVLIIFSSLLKWFGSNWDFDICGIRMSYSVYPSLSKHISLFNSYVHIYSLFAFSSSMHKWKKLFKAEMRGCVLLLPMYQKRDNVAVMFSRGTPLRDWVD